MAPWRHKFAHFVSQPRDATLFVVRGYKQGSNCYTLAGSTPASEPLPAGAAAAPAVRGGAAGERAQPRAPDRKRVGAGKSESVRGNPGGRRDHNKKRKKEHD